MSTPWLRKRSPLNCLKGYETNPTSSAWRFTGDTCVRLSLLWKKKGVFRSLRKVEVHLHQSFFFSFFFFFTSGRVGFKCMYQTQILLKSRNRLGILQQVHNQTSTTPLPPLRERIGWSYTGVNILRLRARFDSDQETQLSHITSEERTNVSMDHKTATLSSPSPNPSPSRKQA